MSECIWIAKLEVRPIQQGSDVLNGCIGAFVHTLVWAKDEKHYEMLVEEAAEELELEIVAINDLETFEQRLTTGYAISKIIKLSEHVNASNPVRFADFDGYSSLYEH